MLSHIFSISNLKSNKFYCSHRKQFSDRRFRIFQENHHTDKTMIISREDPNLTPNKSPDMFSRISLPPTPSDSSRGEDEEEDSTRDSSESNSKRSISPILSQPTTIRFPAEEPKKRRSGFDNGFCQWEDCSFNFESNLALLGHLQVKFWVSASNNRVIGS